MKVITRNERFYVHFREGVEMECEKTQTGLRVNSTILKYYFENVLTEQERNTFEKFYMDIAE
jgi:hypothetical protein